MQKKQRITRTLVAYDKNDKGFLRAKFASALAIFATNDMKYDVYTLRAHTFAEKSQIGIMYCHARDTPTQDAMRIWPDLQSQKLQWLNGHDRENGDLERNACSNDRSY